MTTKPGETGCCMVIATCGSEPEARDLAARIVAEKLAACVQLNPVTSVYTWEGETQTEPETRLVMKTTTGLYKALEEFITANHSYEVPQIVQIPISEGLDAYLDWIGRTTK